ncbi:MAG: methyltransferase domain-containing protein [Burkholderiaceae bacterium]|nr:MAG: methyltransferase domain-containing protein [Burkholderiaceae bacterium]
MVSSKPSLIDPFSVRRNFLRRADAPPGLRALLAREIGGRMLERLACIRLEPQSLLDAGCADGGALPGLRERFPHALPLALDSCLPSLQQGRQNIRAARSFLERLWPRRSAHSPAWLCADFAQLPLASNSLDLLWSNLALHWHDNPAQVFAEWERVLRVQGLVMFSCFGPDTGKQLRAVLGEDAPRRLLPFIDMHDLGDDLVHAGFGAPVMDMEQLTLTYATPEQLLAELASLGGNPLQARPRGLLSRERYRRWCDGLRALAGVDGRIPLTIEVIYGHAWKAQPKQQRTAEGYVTVALDQLRAARRP